MTEYIKREDAVEAFYTATGDGDKADWAVGVIKSIPSADVVERKRGKWIKDCNVAFFWKCSECGAYIFWRKEEYLLRNEDEPNYCPNCGADMRHPDD